MSFQIFTFRLKVCLSIKCKSSIIFNQIGAYFWPSENKGRTCIRPGYFLIQPDEFFLIRYDKMKKLGFFGEIFLNQKWLTWLETTRASKNDPYILRQNFSTWTHCCNGVRVVMWFEAGFLSRQPGFDSLLGKPQTDCERDVKSSLREVFWPNYLFQTCKEISQDWEQVYCKIEVFSNEGWKILLM